MKAFPRAAPRCRCSMPSCGGGERSIRRRKPRRDLKPADQALAVAIAGEALRRLPDFDALIDGATRQRLPDDSKARMVLRVALAQKVGLGTPEHALVATALPLVDGGPRRLVHGVLGTLLRRGVPPMDSPQLPDAVEQRWSKAWGEEVVASARRLIAKRPPLDLSFIDDAEAKAFAEITGGRSLATCHVRLNDAGAVSQLAGLRRGPLVGAGPRRLAAGAVDSSERRRCSRPMRRAGGQDDAVGRSRASSHRRRSVRVAAEAPARESRTHRPRRSARHGGRAEVGA